MISEGTTSTGVKLKICVMYMSEVNDDRPVPITMPMRRRQSWSTDCDLLRSSPALYCLKNPAGRLIILIIIDACTAIEVLVLILLLKKPLRLLMS